MKLTELPLAVQIPLLLSLDRGQRFQIAAQQRREREGLKLLMMVQTPWGHAPVSVRDEEAWAEDDAEVERLLASGIYSFDVAAVMTEARRAVADELSAESLGEPCHCVAGDGTNDCPRFDDCYRAWQEDQVIA